MKHILKSILESPQMPENIAWSRKHFEVNDIVVEEGEPGVSLFFVEAGELRVTGSVDIGQNKRIKPGISDLKKGTVFGESCLHGLAPRIATVAVISEASLLEIKGENLSIYLDANPIQGYLFYKKLFEIMVKRLSSANHAVSTIMAWGLKAHEIDRYL